MADHVIIDGDLAVFLPAFSPAVVVANPGKITGSGKSMAGTKICLEGDEASVEVPGCVYMTPQFTVFGTGTLLIDKLGGDQLSKKTKDSGKQVILKGSTFTAKFKVQNPAKNPLPPTGPVPDPVSEYAGTGNFITTNIKVTAD